MEGLDAIRGCASRPEEGLFSRGFLFVCALVLAGAGKFIAAYYAEGKRKLVKFKSLDAAKKGAKEIIEKLTTGIAQKSRPESPRRLNLVNELSAPGG